MAMPTTHRLHKEKVEEYCRGYPRLAAFMSIDANFLMVKRFDVLHMRYLLFLQDTMTELQERLDACDDAEDVQLHNSSRRQDGNETRKTLMRELEISLTKYDDAILKFRQLLDINQASDYNYQSVRNWIEGNKPLVRSESRLFLRESKDTDIIALKASSGKSHRAQWLTEIAKFVHPRYASMLLSSKTILARTRDAKIFLYDPDTLQRIEFITTVLLASFWLIVPTNIFFYVSHPIARGCVLLACLFGFSTTFESKSAKSKHELLLALTAYCTIFSAFYATNSRSE